MDTITYITMPNLGTGSATLVAIAQYLLAPDPAQERKYLIEAGVVKIDLSIAPPNAVQPAMACFSIPFREHEHQVVVNFPFDPREITVARLGLLQGAERWTVGELEAAARLLEVATMVAAIYRTLRLNS